MDNANELKVDNIYSVYDNQNGGRIIHSMAKYLGEKDDKLEFISINLTSGVKHLLEKGDRYTYVEKHLSAETLKRIEKGNQKYKNNGKS